MPELDVTEMCEVLKEIASVLPNLTSEEVPGAIAYVYHKRKSSRVAALESRKKRDKPVRLEACIKKLLIILVIEEVKEIHGIQNTSEAARIFARECIKKNLTFPKHGHKGQRSQVDKDKVLKDYKNAKSAGFFEIAQTSLSAMKRQSPDANWTTVTDVVINGLDRVDIIEEKIEDLMEYLKVMKNV